VDWLQSNTKARKNPAGPFAFYAAIYRRHRGRGAVIDVGVSIRKAPTFDGILDEIRAWLAMPRSLQGRQERWPDIPAHAVEVFKERSPGYINTEDLVAYVDVADGAIVGVRKPGEPKKGEHGFARLTRTNPQGVSMDFEHYAEGPFDEGDPRNEIALEVKVKRGMVTAREWQSLAGYVDDPADQDKFSYQSFSMLLGSLLDPKARFRGSYSGDEGWSLRDVQELPSTPSHTASALGRPVSQQQDAIVSVAISRLAYGPNDERVVSHLGDRR